MEVDFCLNNAHRKFVIRGMTQVGIQFGLRVTSHAPYGF